MRLAWIIAAATLACGCPHNGSYQQPAQLPTAKDVIARLAKLRDARTSFRVQTTMDYWLGKQRVKGKVRVMGTSKRQVRFNAIKPDDTVLVDMACNGTDFTFVDFQNNCQLAGPCNKSSIASLLHVELEPDDFHAFAQGVPPVIDNADGTVTWDAKHGQERVALEGPAGKQTLVIDARDNHFDVVSSELRDPAGKVVWSVENSDFHEVKDVTGTPQRVPGKTRFKNPRQEADLLVDWLDEERAINLEIDAAKFTVPIPSGLPSCGGTQAAPSPGTPATSPSGGKS
jgi:hypothetical protein